MDEKKYTIGLVFGITSARAILVELSDGTILASSTQKYRHGIMEGHLFVSGQDLKPGWALNDPSDYLLSLRYLIKDILKQSQVNPEDIIAVGVSANASAMLPTLADGTPLAYLDDFKNDPHAYVKTRKHEAAQIEADLINDLAVARFEGFLDNFGGKINADWFFPKVLQTVRESPHVHHNTSRYVEVGDWIVWQLTGVESRNITAAGFTALWTKTEGFPSDDFLKLLHPGMEHIVQEKMCPNVTSLGTNIGGITPKAAKLLGLNPGTIVATAMVDFMAAVPASAVVEPGDMVIMLGSNNVHMILAKKQLRIPGMCGVVSDGIIPGYFGYEAGQACVGDHFKWFIQNCVPSAYEKEAKKQKTSVFNLLEEKAAKLQAGESGLIALDWWNGNRSILADNDLSGLILGLNLATKPEEIYRVLLEATAFGTRKILETFLASGIHINGLIATGTVARNNPVLMQIFADVTNMEVRIAESADTPALGAAMYASVAAGQELGGHNDIQAAAHAMTHLRKVSYLPETAAKKVYDRFYAEYTRLHDYFGYSHNDVMKFLKAIRKDIKEKL